MLSPCRTRVKRPRSYPGRPSRFRPPEGGCHAVPFPAMFRPERRGGRAGLAPRRAARAVAVVLASLLLSMVLSGPRGGSFDWPAASADDDPGVGPWGEEGQEYK